MQVRTVRDLFCSQVRDPIKIPEEPTPQKPSPLPDRFIPEPVEPDVPDCWEPRLPVTEIKDWPGGIPNWQTPFC